MAKCERVQLRRESGQSMIPFHLRPHFTPCEYHYGNATECRLVQLRYDHQRGWHKPIWLCDACREYLFGLFRYVRCEQTHIEHGSIDRNELSERIRMAG